MAGGRFSAVTNATLSISNLVAGNAADYVVVVTNSSGSVTSAVATLTVQIPVPPSITASPASQTNYVGQMATFTVSAAGSPPLYFHWQGGATGSAVYTNLMAGGWFSSVTNATLSIGNLSTNNAASYVVVVTNWFGSVTSAVATLTVLTNLSPTNALARDNQWYNQAKIGFMMTWGMQTGGKAGASTPKCLLQHCRL